MCVRVCAVVGRRAWSQFYPFYHVQPAIKLRFPSVVVGATHWTISSSLKLTASGEKQTNSRLCKGKTEWEDACSTGLGDCHPDHTSAIETSAQLMERPTITSQQDIQTGNWHTGNVQVSLTNVQACGPTRLTPLHTHHV